MFARGWRLPGYGEYFVEIGIAIADAAELMRYPWQPLVIGGSHRNVAG